MALSFAKTMSQLLIQSLLGLLCLSCVLATEEPCQSALDNGKINPVSKSSGGVWTVDPFIIPPKGTCKQMPVDGDGKYLNMDFDAYPNITAQCDDRIKFVMRTVSRQQRHGVYLTEFAAGSWPPCPPPLFNDEKACDVRLNESDQKDTQCQGYSELYPLLMFGPNDTIIKEYTTPTFRTMVAADKDTDVLVFSCPWIKGRRSTSGIYKSHCMEGMFVQVTVQGCKDQLTPSPTCGEVKDAYKASKCCGSPGAMFKMDGMRRLASSEQMDDPAAIVNHVAKALKHAKSESEAKANRLAEQVKKVLQEYVQ